MADEVSNWVIRILDGQHGSVRLTDFTDAPADLQKYLAAMKTRNKVITSGSPVDNEEVVFWLLTQLNLSWPTPDSHSVVRAAMNTGNRELIARVIDLLAHCPSMHVAHIYNYKTALPIIVRDYVVNHLKAVLESSDYYVICFYSFKLICAKMDITASELFYTVKSIEPCEKRTPIFLMIEKCYFDMIKWFFENCRPDVFSEEVHRDCLANTLPLLLRSRKMLAADKLADWIESKLA